MENNENDTLNNISVEQKINQVNESIQRLQEFLVEKRLAAIPSIVYESIGKASFVLPIIIKKISQLIEENNSLRALAKIGQIVNSTIELDEVLQKVMDTIIKITGAERGFLMIKDEDGELTTRVARNWEKESLDTEELSVSKTIINRVISGGQALLTTNAQDDPRFMGQDSITNYNLRSILCVPLIIKNQLIGVIYADNRIRSGLFTKKQLGLLSDFANQAAVAIDNASLFNSVKKALVEVTELKDTTDNIFESITSGVLTLDKQKRIIMCNHAAQEIIGLNSKQMLGKSLDKILPVYDSYLDIYIKKVLEKNQKIIGLETSFQIKLYEKKIIRFSLSPLKDIQKNNQGIAVVFEDLTEIKRLEGQKSLFQRMVAPAVIEQLDPNSLALGGQKKEITIFFGDIRGFTSFGERVPAEGLVSVLNRYLAMATDAILNEEGTVDKFLGDAVMAWFNAPIPQKDHTLRAVRAALSINKAIPLLHQDLHPDVRLKFGMGIHVGEAVLGLIGTEKRLDYTAIGDAVNTAKRIQENTVSGEILISQKAYETIMDDIIVKERNPIFAKGKQEPLIVYEVLGLKEIQ